MKVTGNTAEKLMGGAAQLLMRGGYNGFSYADLAERFGIRKPSIHHHFPAKADLVTAVVEHGRSVINAQIEALDEGGSDGMAQLLAYVGYWKRCIADQSAPFCLAGVLAAEMPILPPPVAAAVRGHFADLGRWLEEVLTRGVEQGKSESIRLTPTSWLFFSANQPRSHFCAHITCSARSA